MVEDIITNIIQQFIRHLKYFINCQRRSYTQFKLRLTFTHFSAMSAVNKPRRYDMTRARLNWRKEIDRLQFSTFIFGADLIVVVFLFLFRFLLH